MIESVEYVFIELKASGKDKRNPKYVVKLIIIVDYRSKKMFLKNEMLAVRKYWRNYGIEMTCYWQGNFEDKIFKRRGEL